MSFWATRSAEADLLPHGHPGAVRQSGAAYRPGGNRQTVCRHRSPALDPATGRAMLICGSPAMLADTCAMLSRRGFRVSKHRRSADYVIERAFVEK